MSDNVQWVVDLEASEEDAEELAGRVRGWLLAQGVVSEAVCAEPSYGGAELLLPGPCAGRWSDSDDWQSFSMRGLEIVTTRTVFHTGDSGVQGLRCPRCSAVHGADDLAWGDAVGVWFEAHGHPAMRCPACGCDSSIVDWQFLELAWGFGNLAFGFWNWAISEQLADDIARVLGHRCRRVFQHL